MLGFQKLYEETQEQVKDTSAASLVVIKRGINQGAKKFGAVLNRDWRTTKRLFSTVGTQQYYFLPADCIRIKTIVITIDGTEYPLVEIANEDEWNDLNRTDTTSDIPEHYFIRGNNEVGIFPIPATSNANAGLFRYERRMRDMSQADYTTGTVVLTNNSTTITGTGTTFTSAMVGRWIRIDDPNGDGMWYKIIGFTSTTVMTLEKAYDGDTTTSLAFTISEMPDIPEEFHESLIDYGCYRYYLRRKDRTQASAYLNSFKDSVVECEANYSSKTSSQYVRANANRSMQGGYVHSKRDRFIV